MMLNARGKKQASEANRVPTHARVRAFLESVAKRRIVITYQELANALRILPPHSIHRVTEALEHFQRAVDKRNLDPRVHNNYGDALRRLGRLQDASRKYADALAVAPANDPVHDLARNNLALTEQEIALSYVTAENWAAAIPHFEAALKADRNLLSSQTGLAEARRRLGSRSQ